MTPAPDLFCTVASLLPFELREEKPGLIPNYFYIPASDMKFPQILKVGTARHYVYLDQDRGHLPVRTPSTEVAASIVRDYITSQPKVSPEAQPALFWVPGEASGTEILKKYNDLVIESLLKQNRWFTSICQQADDDWSKYHRHTVVSDFQRNIAKVIGWNPEHHEWMSANPSAIGTHCPGCGSMTPLGAAICPFCRCIIDPERYKSLQFADRKEIAV